MKEVVRGASVAFTLKVVAAGLGFALQVALARVLGAEGVGLFYLALMVLTIAATFGRIGLENTTVRFIAASRAAGDLNRLHQVYRKVLWAGGAGSLLMTVLMLAGSYKASIVFPDPRMGPLLRIAALAVVPTALAMLFSELHRGLKRISESIFLLSISTSALTLAGLGLLGRTAGIETVLYLYVGAVLATMIIGILLWRRALPAPSPAGGADFKWSELFNSAIPLFWVGCLQMVLLWTSTLFLGSYRSPHEVGIYEMAARTARLMAYVLIAVNSIAAPKFSALYQKGDMKVLEKIARRSALLMAVLAFPLLLAFLIAPGWILHFFGPQFTEGAAVLSIIAVGQFVNVATGSVGVLLVMCGQERLLRNANASTAVACLLLSYILIPPYGAIGAAVATSVVLVVQNLVMAFLVRLRLGINTIPFFGGSGTVQGPKPYQTVTRPGSH